MSGARQAPGGVFLTGLPIPPAAYTLLHGPAVITDDPSSTTPAALVALKVVPGAGRDEVVGPLGERLKVRVAAPPEDGKANKAVCKLLAKALGLKPAAVEIRTGLSSPEKMARIDGLRAAEVRARLALT